MSKSNSPKINSFLSSNSSNSNSNHYSFAGTEDHHHHQSPPQHNNIMNQVLQRLDLRRPSFAQASGVQFDDGPNGADIQYSQDHNNISSSSNSVGSGSQLSNSRNAGEDIDIVVIGDEGASKARFISIFLDNGIENDPTNVISCCKPVTTKNGTYNVKIHTNVGQEEFWGVNDVYNRQGHGFVFVYNINSKESFNMFTQMREKILFDKGVENVIMAMVGIASDVNDNEHGDGDNNNSNGGRTSSFGGSSSLNDSMVFEEASSASLASGSHHGREVTYAEAKRMADLYNCTLTEITSFEGNEAEIHGSITELIYRITNSGNASSLSTKQQQTTEIAVLGDLFVGKSQFVQRCLGNSFGKSYRETTEWTRNIMQRQLNDMRYFVKLVDTRGLMIEELLTRERLVTTQGFVFMYSITSRNSFHILESLRKKVLGCKSETKVPCILIANKSDCTTLARQVKTEEGRELAQKWGCQFFEISVMTSDEEEIQKLIGNLLADMHKMTTTTIDIGEFKKEGYLMKEGKKLKSMSRYYFKLKRGSLYYCKNQAHTKNIKSMELNESVQVQILGGSNEKRDIWPFSIVLYGKQMNLIASSEADRDAWITSIKINCYVNEFVNTIMEDVLTTMVTEISQQSQQQNSLHKRSDSIKGSASTSSNNLMSYVSNNNSNSNNNNSIGNSSNSIHSSNGGISPPLSLSPDSPFLTPSPPSSDSSIGGDSPPTFSSLNGQEKVEATNQFKKNLNGILQRTSSFSRGSPIQTSSPGFKK